MIKQTQQHVVKIAIGAAILWGGLAGGVLAAESANGIRLTNGVSTNGIRLTNGVATNGIRLTNGSAITGRQDAPALRSSRLCTIEPEFCGAHAPQAQPSNVNVRFVTLPDGKTHVLE
jgi:hypothetical protein